jgi:hypothetical protein
VPLLVSKRPVAKPYIPSPDDIHLTSPPFPSPNALPVFLYMTPQTTTKETAAIGAPLLLDIRYTQTPEVSFPLPLHPTYHFSFLLFITCDLSALGLSHLCFWN